MNRKNIAPFIQSLTFDASRLAHLPFVKISSVEVTNKRNIKSVEDLPHFAIRVYDMADGQICNVWLKLSDYTGREKPMEPNVAERLMKRWVESLLAELSQDHETVFKLVNDGDYIASMPYMAPRHNYGRADVANGGRGRTSYSDGNASAMRAALVEAQLVAGTEPTKMPTEEELAEARLLMEARRLLTMLDLGEQRYHHDWNSLVREGIFSQEKDGEVRFGLILKIAKGSRLEAWPKGIDLRRHGFSPSHEQAITGTLKLLGQECRFEVLVAGLGDQAYHAVSRALIQYQANTRFREMAPFAIDEQGALELHFDTIEQ